MRKWFYSLSALLIPLAFAIACTEGEKPEDPEVPEDPAPQDPGTGGEGEDPNPDEPDTPDVPIEPEEPSGYQAKYEREEYPQSNHFSESRENEIRNYALDLLKEKGSEYFEKYIEPYEAIKWGNRGTDNDLYILYIEFRTGRKPNGDGIFTVFNFQELYDFAHYQWNVETDLWGHNYNRPWDELSDKDKEWVASKNPFRYQFQFDWYNSPRK